MDMKPIICTWKRFCIDIHGKRTVISFYLVDSTLSHLLGFDSIQFPLTAVNLRSFCFNDEQIRQDEGLELIKL